MDHARRLFLSSLTLAALAGLSPAIAGPAPMARAAVATASDQHGDPDLDRDLDRIRRATRAYRDIEAARAEGYPRSVPEHCMDSPAGGMGYHYVNYDLFDDQLDVEKPEILVYRPTRDGTLELAGVEYVVPYSAWHRKEAPRLLGQDLKRADNLRIWYLHVWAWERNRNGVFADWNPAVKCAP